MWHSLIDSSRLTRELLQRIIEIAKVNTSVWSLHAYPYAETYRPPWCASIL
jgi:hypothetical protein